MYSTKMSFKSLILVSTLVVYSICQVSALECYVCSSDSNGECYKKPKQDQYRGSCFNWQSNGLASYFSTSMGNIAQTTISDYTRSQSGNYNINEQHCVTITGEIGNKDHVVRVCSPKMMDCNLWKSALPTKYSGLYIKTCDTCEYDLCNSSPHLSVGFLSLIGCLLTILWFRN